MGWDLAHIYDAVFLLSHSSNTKKYVYYYKNTNNCVLYPNINKTCKSKKQLYEKKWSTKLDLDVLSDTLMLFGPAFGNTHNENILISYGWVV